MKRTLLIGLTLIGVSAMKPVAADVVYRRAIESDIPGVLSMLEEANSYSDNIVVHPIISCRKSFVKEMINKNRLFLAMDGNNVVASEELFIADGTEKTGLLKNIIRSEGEKAKLPPFRGVTNNKGVITAYSGSIIPKAPEMGVSLYAGFEYTREAFRGKGINKKLREFTYSEIAESVLNALQKSSVKNITLFYGLSASNAGMLPSNASHDRTPLLAANFQSFIKKYIYPHVDITSLELSRFNIVLPTYDPKSSDCTKLLSDEQSDHAYSYILTYESK